MTDAALRLREGTALSHALVDKAYSSFDLATRRGYGDFLTAMARVLPWAEIAAGNLADPRTPALFADLAAMGLARPRAVVFRPLNGAAAWGAAYVLEGSRLGAKVLERRVAPGLPRAFLGQGHASGGWAGFRERLNAAADGEAWIAAALTSAREMFGAFETAAQVREAALDR